MFNYREPNEILRPEEILIYLRKSRADDPLLSVEEVLSKHESILNTWCERNLGELIPDENRFKEIVSGESISERVEFQRVLKLIESPKIKAVLVKEISRIGRPDTAEIGMISKIFRYTNTLVITPERTFNVTDDFEREMFEAELKRGNYYLEATKKLLRTGRELSVKSGNCVASIPPYGYDKTIVTDGRRKCPTLVINEEQAAVVRNIFEWYVNENIGTQRIANRLNELGIKSPRGKLWTGDSIRDILRNVHYIGKVIWNQRKGIYVVNDGVFRKTRPKSPEDEVIISEGKHEAIVSEELFNEAQEKRGRTHKTCSNKELRNPLASILFCECGRAMCYRHSTRGDLKYREPRLVCNGQKHCGNGSCSVTELVDYVVEVLQASIADFESKIEKGNAESTDFHEKHLQTLEKKLSELDAKEVTLWEEQLDKENRMPRHVFQTLLDKLSTERKDIEKAIEKTKSIVTTPVIYETQLINLKKALSALLDPDVSVAEKNQFLKACIERIDYKREAPQKVIGKGVGRQWTSPPIEVNVRMKV